MCFQNGHLDLEDFLKPSLTSLMFAVGWFWSAEYLATATSSVRNLVLIEQLRKNYCLYNSAGVFSHVLFHRLSLSFEWELTTLGVFDNCNQSQACHGFWTWCSLEIPTNPYNSVIYFWSTGHRKCWAENWEIMFCELGNFLLFFKHFLYADSNNRWDSLQFLWNTVLCSRFMYYKFKQNYACFAPVHVGLQYYGEG